MSATVTNQQLIDIANTYGTPVYVYHAEKIKEQYQKLTNAFEGMDVLFFYACKALTNISVLQYVKEIGCNVDCSSLNEVKLALHAGFPASRILYTSNNISFEEIEEVKELGAFINIDSLSNIEKFGKRFGNSYPVGVRLRPNIMAGGNLKISTGHDKSKFGIPLEQVNELVAIAKQYNIRITDLHIHTGSDIKDAAVFVKGIEVLFDILHLFPHVTSIDLGGGFKVPYHDDEKETDLNEVAAQIKAMFERHPEASRKKFQLWFEPGKFLVSACGHLITRVNVIKYTPNVTFAGVDTGLNHLIRPMFYDAYHKIENISNENGMLKKYTVVGNICETDTFASDRELNEVREGDLIAIRNSGAYGFEMASNYNSRYKPAEVLIEDGVAHLIRKRDEFNDLLHGQVFI